MQLFTHIYQLKLIPPTGKIDGVSEKADTFGDDGLKRFDAGLGLGVAFEFGKIVVGVETGTSFTKVASGASAYNLSALATIGYKF